MKDTGIGIPSELLPRVFEPFIQEERSPDRANGGLGIGLALVRSLVELHGGKVEAFSAGRGKGSEFVLHFPVLPEVPSAARHANQRQRAERRYRAAAFWLLTTTSTVPKRSACCCGWAVTRFKRPTAAVRLSKSCALNRPEIVMLDIGMPGMDGLEVARRLRDELGLTRTSCWWQ